LRKSLDLISPEINTYGKWGGDHPLLAFCNLRLSIGVHPCSSVVTLFCPCLSFSLVPLPRHCHWGQNVYAGRETIWAALVSNILWVPGLEGLVSPASAGSEYRSLRMRSHPAT